MSNTQHKLDKARPPRVQITYDVETGDAETAKELPLVIGVLGEYSSSEKPLRERKFISIDKDNFDEVEVTSKVARKDKDGKRVKEVVDGKKVTVYDEVEKTIKKDSASRLHARRQMLKVLYTAKESDGTKKGTKTIDVTNKLFDEIAPKYATRNGGYTRIVKIGQRKGDGALEVLLELV